MITLSDHGPIIAFSPHLDDAAMGVGATLAALSQAGRQVVLCTVFAGEHSGALSPVAHAFHADCGLGPDAVAQRKDEDRQAAAAIGAKVVHLPFPDAIYRRHDTRWLCETPRAMFDAEQPDESSLVSSISAAIERIVHDYQPSALWTCAAIGGHIDHRLTRQALSESSRRHGWAPLLWEGVPYAFGLEPPAGVRLVTVADVTGEHLTTKIDAIERYSSQLRMLFGEDDDWRTAFLNHAKARRALGCPELLWPMPL